MSTLIPSISDDLDSNFSLSPIRNRADIIGPDSFAWISAGHMVATATGVSNLLSWCRHCIVKGLQKAGNVVLPHRWYYQELQKTLDRLDVLERELQTIKNKTTDEVMLEPKSCSCCTCPNCGKNITPGSAKTSTASAATVPPPSPLPPPPPPPPPPIKSVIHNKPLERKRKALQNLETNSQQLHITTRDLQKVKLRKVEVQTISINNDEATDKNFKEIALKKSQTTAGPSLQDRIASEVLSFKGQLKKTTLKRSPGGTPIVSKKRKRQTGRGLTPVMARALQHRFMNARNSPSSSESSPEVSPLALQSSTPTDVIQDETNVL